MRISDFWRATVQSDIKIAFAETAVFNIHF